MGAPTAPGPLEEKQQREKEREELKILVGTNLVRLSQLDSATLEIYSKLILPGILSKLSAVVMTLPRST